MSIIWPHMKITVSTAMLKQQLSHYLALAREGKDVLVTNHRRIIARVLSEEGKDPGIPEGPGETDRIMSRSGSLM